MTSNSTINEYTSEEPIIELMNAKYETLILEPLNDYAKSIYKTNHEQIARHDSGYDLYYCGETVEVLPFNVAKLKLGVRCEFIGIGSADENNNICYERRRTIWSHGYELWPRSSISKTPLQMANSIGLIDANYRGEIMACVRNVSNECYTIEKGAKLFQLCMPDKLPFYVNMEKHMIDTIDLNTLRGEGGFGSTNNV